jgi:hypothetical protein
MIFRRVWGWVLATTLGCAGPQTKVLAPWLRVHSPGEETVLIPHNWHVGGGATIVEVKQGNNWVPVVQDHGDLRVWLLGNAERALVRTEGSGEAQGRFFLLGPSPPHTLASWPQVDCVMAPTLDGNRLVRVTALARDAAGRDPVEIEHFDMQGQSLGVERTVLLPQHSAHSGSRCYWGEIEGFIGEAVVLRDAVCGLGAVKLSDPLEALTSFERVKPVPVTWRWEAD